MVSLEREGEVTAGERERRMIWGNQFAGLYLEFMLWE